MPIFRQHSLLFIHIPKNAGRSIERTLLTKPLGPDSGQRSLINRAATFVRKHTESKVPQLSLIGTLDYTLCAQHLTFSEIQVLDLVSAEQLSLLRSFCVVRNPYDRAISSVMHFNNFGSGGADLNPASFERALQEWIESPAEDHNHLAHKRRQTEFLKDKDGMVGDHEVLRFENLTQDFEKFCQKLGLGDLSLPKVGSVGRKSHYRDLYSNRSRKLVETEFGVDIEFFNYDF